MTEMSKKTHCGLCDRILSKSNRAGLGTECRKKMPETLTVALLNRSEHAHHEGGSHDGILSVSDIDNAFTHLGGTADLLIFVSGYTQGNHLLEEGQANWEIWYRSNKGKHFIDATSQKESFIQDDEYKATLMDDEDMRKYVLLMCSKSTKTKVKLTWVDSELGFMMNRAHYNGPYPPGMDLEEWAREIHDVSHEKFQTCWTCDQAQFRTETKNGHEDEIQQRVLQFEEFKEKFPDLRHSLYGGIVAIKNSIDEHIIEHIESMFDDIRKDEHNRSEPFIGSPMWYDPTDSHEAYWNYNSIQAGEIEWLTVYGNFVFVEYLLPYLLNEAYALFNEDWTPREHLPASWDKPDFVEWVTRRTDRILQRDDYSRALLALEHTLDEMYPRAQTQCKETDCEFCDN